MEAFFSYFVKFNKDGLILLKDYSKDYAVNRFNKRPIIINIYNENTFPVNDGR